MINYKDKMVEVTWMDAAGEMKVDKSKLDAANASDFLIMNKTYGLFYKEDENAILILTEDSQSEVDYCVIPKTWVIKNGIKILKYTKV